MTNRWGAIYRPQDRTKQTNRWGFTYSTPPGSSGQQPAGQQPAGRQGRRFWEDFDPDVRREALRSAFHTDAAKVGQFEDWGRQLADGSSTIHTFQGQKPDDFTWSRVMNASDRRAFAKQARRDWKRSAVKSTAVHKIGGGVDVVASRRRGAFEGGGIEGGVTGNVRTTIASFRRDGKGGLVQTFDFFKDNPRPEDAARAFGVPFESAFDKLPQPRPKKPDEENKR